MKKTRSAVTAVLVGALLASQAAEEPAAPAVENRFVPCEKGSVQFGGLLTVFDSTLAFGVNRAAGVSFDAEELFGLDTTRVVLRAEAMYRPGQKLAASVRCFLREFSSQRECQLVGGN